MKRKGILYPEIYNLKNIFYVFNEICRNTRNKRKVARFKEYKSIYISRVYNTLISKTYKPRSL